MPDGLPSELLERRPDLVAAERRVAAAFYAIQSAKAARLPKIALTASGGRSTNDLFYLLGISPDFWQTGVGFLAPIFTGGQLKAQVEIATAEQRAALALYGQAALRAFSDVETHWPTSAFSKINNGISRPSSHRTATDCVSVRSATRWAPPTC